MIDAHPSEAWFQLVVEAAPNAMLVVDGEREIRLVNRGAEALFGYDRRELIGRAVEVLLPPRFAGRHAAHFRDFSRSPSARGMGSGRDLYGLRKDGTEVAIEIGLSPVETPAGRFTVASIVDITERTMLRERFREAQDAAARLNRELEARVEARTEELRRSEALQRAVVTYAGPAIIATDPGGTITLFNRAAEELLGYAAVELIGAASPVLIHDPAEVDARRAALERELGVTIASPFEVFVIKSRSHGADANEWTYVRKDGSRVPVLLTVSSIRGGGGEVVGFLGVAVDLTRRKEQEGELLELNRLLGERSAQREVLLQEVHHRVKNNLQIIASLVSMQIRHVADASARAALAECRARVESIALIHETLYQSKGEARVPFSDYAQTLAQSIVRAAGPSGVALALDIEALALPVDAAIPCGLILNELVTNALKHAFPGGRRGTVRVSLRRSAAGEAALTVADDGVGLADDFAERPTRSLGLQLVAALVAQIDGRLEVSRAGGARFCVSFPLPEPP